MTNFKKAFQNINPAFKQGFTDGLALPFMLFSTDYSEARLPSVKRPNISLPTNNVARSWRNVGTALTNATSKHKHLADEKIAS